MATLALQVSETGATAPDLQNILQQLRIVFWGIYGSDANLDPDSQDGQFLATIAQAIYDCNSMGLNIFNAFAPSTAQGVQLSKLVKLNGLTRKVATESQVDILITGAVGTTINNGVVGDNLGLNTRWSLPSVVNIPDSGEITVTATCTEVGATQAPVDTLTQILTPTQGWQTATNPAVATLGSPIETDAQLRQRQTLSTAFPAQTILESIFAAIDALPGVQRLFIYENQEDVATGEGIPGHSISVVVAGGDVDEIAATIAAKKPPGAGTYGSTSRLIVDQNNVPSTIRFFQLAGVPIKVEITIDTLPGYVATTDVLIKQAVVDFINSLQIGEDSYLVRLYTPSNLGGVGLGSSFVVTDIDQARGANPLSSANVTINFNEAATCTIDNVSLVKT